MRRFVLVALSLVALPPVARAERRLTLAEAVDLALGADPQLASARVASERARLGVLRAQLDRVSFRVDGAMSELWNRVSIGNDPSPQPLCTTSEGYALSLPPSVCGLIPGASSTTFTPGTGGWQGLTNLSADVRVPLFSGFRVTSQVEAAKRQEDVTAAVVRQARKDVALAVARAYWGVRRLELARDVVGGAVTRLKESEVVTGSRLAAGLAPTIDKNRSLQQRLQQEAVVADLAGQARESAAQLAALLGIDDDLVLVEGLEVPESGPPALPELMATATKVRPELARAQLAFAVQEQQVRIVRSEYYPQLTAIGLFQYGNNQFNAGSGARSFSTASNPFGGMTGSVTMGLQLNWNIFNMMTTWSREKDARFELARLGEELRLARRQVEIDVRVARARLAHLYGQREPLAAALTVARDNVKIIEARYRNGDAMIIELIQGQVDLTALERQLADLSAQIHLAWLELDAALGNVVGVTR